MLEQNLKPAAGPRPEAAKVVILVTDGKSQDDARAAGRVLKSLDVEVFAVGEQPGSLWVSRPQLLVQVAVWVPASRPTPGGPVASLSRSSESAEREDPCLLQELVTVPGQGPSSWALRGGRRVGGQWGMGWIAACL